MVINKILFFFVSGFLNDRFANIPKTKYSVKCAIFLIINSMFPAISLEILPLKIFKITLFKNPELSSFELSPFCAEK